MCSFFTAGIIGLFEAMFAMTPPFFYNTSLKGLHCYYVPRHCEVNILLEETFLDCIVWFIVVLAFLSCCFSPCFTRKEKEEEKEEF